MLVFCFGCFGGLAVNIFWLYWVSLEPREDLPDFNGIYFSQFLGLALTGGVLALAHHLTQPITPIVAVNLGLSIPALAKATAGTFHTSSKAVRVD